MHKLFAALLLILGAGSAHGQPAETTVDASARTAVIEAAIAALERSYVFPEVAALMAVDLRTRERAGEYSGIASASALARRLTEHLQA